MYRKTVIDISQLAAAVMLACTGMSVWATVSSPVGIVSGRQITVTGKPEIEYVRTQNSVQVKSLPTHNDPDNDLLSDWRYVWKIDGAEVKAEAGAGSATVIPVHPILSGEYNKPAQLCLKAVTATGYPESTRTSAETCSDEVQLTNSAPTASNVAVSGTLTVGRSLTASYGYADADGDSEAGQTVQWYRSDNATGTNKAAITGATAGSYQLVTADEGKYLSVAITPTSATGLSPGSEVESALVGPAQSLLDQYITPRDHQLTHSAAIDECIRQGRRLATTAELLELYAAYPNNQLLNIYNWPTRHLYWTSDPRVGGNANYVFLHNGSTGSVDYMFPRFYACIRI